MSTTPHGPRNLFGKLRWMGVLLSPLFLVLVASVLLPMRSRAWSTPAQEEGAAATHHIRTVFIILMENHNWTGDVRSLNIKGNPAAPYINGTLIPMSSYTNNYSNPPGNHPSLPNYLWLEAGTNFGILNDNDPSSNTQSTTFHLVDQVENAGLTWKAYEENIPGTNCPLVNTGPIDPDGDPLYAVRHDPVVYFDDVNGHLNPNSPRCIAHVRPFSELAQDLKDDTVASYNFITPNVCDDMHDNCAGNPIAHGDTWLSKHVPAILDSYAFQSAGVLFITWDEANNGDGPVPMIVLSPFAKGHGYTNQLLYTHGSTARTLQEIFGLTPLMRDAKRQQDLSDLFSQFP
ncbi:MAG: alkaline phosphatase family protein [Terriglobia bacterium]